LQLHCLIRQHATPVASTAISSGVLLALCQYIKCNYRKVRNIVITRQRYIIDNSTYNITYKIARYKTRELLEGKPPAHHICTLTA
jgi:hypothetical protein